MKSKILFIDDDPLIIQKYVPKMVNEGFEVITVSNEQEAEQMIEKSSDFKLVITDLEIFKNNHSVNKHGRFGLNLIKTIKEKHPNLPIIVFTSYLLKYSKDLETLGVLTVISKSESDAIDKLKSFAHEIIDHSAESLEIKLSLPEKPEEVRKILIEELDKEIRAKAKILSIPEEGDFEIIKHLVGFKDKIEKQITKFPYSKNVFLMMKFRPSNQILSDHIIEILSKHGLRGIRADQVDWNITNDLFNPFAVLYCCKYGIALFDEAEEHQAYSANVAYELGFMHCQNKEYLMLRHTSLPDMPFDFIKDLHQPYKDGLEVTGILERWIKQISN